MATELRDLKVPTTILQFPPFPMNEYGDWSALEKKNTRGKIKSAEVPSCLLRSALAPSHTFLGKSWFVCNVVKYRLIQCRDQKQH